MNPDRMNKRKAYFANRQFAKLDGYRIAFNKTSAANPVEGFANIIPDDDSTVEGALYKVEFQSVERLDYFEGYPDAYRREEVWVTTSDGGKHKAITYIANDNQTSDSLKPSREYLNHLLRGRDLLSAEYCSLLEKTDTFD
jgi:gamma-glutamylcyclotransferase (GGCT)/AIG2-like uncharacterized protein YtfP